MRHYKQLSQEQRHGIYTLLKTGHNQAEIAVDIGVHKSTVSRELCRNCGYWGYRYKQAHRLAVTRRQGKAKLHINWSLLGLHRTVDTDRLEPRVDRGVDGKRDGSLCQSRMDLPIYSSGQTSRW